MFPQAFKVNSLGNRIAFLELNEFLYAMLIDYDAGKELRSPSSTPTIPYPPVG
jgi:hypothetical protein